MNAGYLSLVLILILIVFIMTDWYTEILGKISPASMLLFIFTWIVGLAFHVEWGDVQLSGAIIVMLGFALYAWLRRVTGIRRLHVIAFSLLFAMTYVWMELFYRIDPPFIMGHVWRDSTILLGIGLFICVRKPIDQWICSVFGFVFGSWFLQVWMLRQSTIMLGTADLFDQWILVFVIARLCAFVTTTVVRSSRGMWHLISRKY